MGKRHLYKKLVEENYNEETSKIDELRTVEDETKLLFIKFQGNRLKNRRGGIHIENGKLLKNELKFYILMEQLKWSN